MARNKDNLIRNKVSISVHIDRQIIVCLLILFIFFSPLILLAQTYPTRHYTMRDGLPDMSIQSIYKDSRGLMWIGTNSGLCTYDGKSFNIFKPSEGMTANRVWAIAEDDMGNMWFGSYGEGLYKYDGRNFKRYTQDDGLFGNKIRVLCWSEYYHCLIAGGEGGVSSIRGDSIMSSSPGVFAPDKGAPVTGLGDMGKFIYVTTYGINNPLRFYPETNEFIEADTSNLRYPGNSFSVFLTSRKDTVFSSGHYGVKIFKHNNEIIQNESMGQIFGIAEDIRGDLWFASWSYPKRNMIEGIFKYDGSNFINYKNAFGITDKEIWTVFYDREQDILWIGTVNEGLFMVQFSHIEQFPPEYFGLEEQIINDVYVDNRNNLWISGIKELIRMEPDGDYSIIDRQKILSAVRKYWNKTKREDPDIDNDETIFTLSKRLDNLINNDFDKNIDFNFQQVKENSNHSILFTNRLGIFQYDHNNGKIEYLLPAGETGLFAVTGNDTVVFTGWGTTLIYNDIKNVDPNKPDPSYETFMEGDYPRNTNRVVKRDNKLWYTSYESGLWMSEGMSLVNFNKADSSISTNLNDVCFDEGGHVFFGSNSGEIYIATYSDKKLKIDYRINSEEGLYGNSISWLVYDPKGYLWAGTNLGLNCIYLKDLYENGDFTIRFFDEEDGYKWQSSQKADIDKDERIWIGVFDQIVCMDTKGLLTKDVQAGNIYLRSLEVNNIPADLNLKNDFSSGQEITFNQKLKHFENDLIFSFDILNYKNPNKDLFRHKLIGYDGEWLSWGNSRKVAYTNLSPGNYDLLVESKNIQNLNQTKPLIIHFKIKYPFWGLWYLQLLAAIIIILTVVYAVHVYEKSKRKKKELKIEIEKTIAELEMQALQAQMNPHFIFNCINGIQYYVLSNQMDEVMAYLSDFSKVVRGSLENATIPMVKLESEVEFLLSYLRLEEMRFEDKFDYEIEMQNTTMAETRLLPPMFIQPFVENSIKHGFNSLTTKGHLLIQFEEAEEDVLKCSITDNGIGRKKSAEKESVIVHKDRLHSGLITENRIRLFNKPGDPERYKIIYTDLEFDGSSAGLKVEIYLPMEKVNDLQDFKNL